MEIFLVFALFATLSLAAGWVAAYEHLYPHARQASNLTAKPAPATFPGSPYREPPGREGVEASPLPVYQPAPPPPAAKPVMETWGIARRGSIVRPASRYDVPAYVPAYSSSLREYELEKKYGICPTNGPFDIRDKQIRDLEDQQLEVSAEINYLKCSTLQSRIHRYGFEPHGKCAELEARWQTLHAQIAGLKAQKNS